MTTAESKPADQKPLTPDGHITASSTPAPKSKAAEFDDDTPIPDPSYLVAAEDPVDGQKKYIRVSKQIGSGADVRR